MTITIKSGNFKIPEYGDSLVSYLLEHLNYIQILFRISKYYVFGASESIL